ncbi:hypothetical protein BDV95DRAFT_611827 [Massariosphaeria phaeospora]|uniref:Uncharacterized protein n=1 Tax=Massariosphaeria phaeospora TaxID=100035 RepID=A0A7C8HZK4_9PLEO|nr:hypothetical protein BDV95DRAFT_611827 [Massariosphaeria phaeospora]
MVNHTKPTASASELATREKSKRLPTAPAKAARTTARFQTHRRDGRQAHPPQLKLVEDAVEANDLTDTFMSLPPNGLFTFAPTGSVAGERTQQLHSQKLFLGKADDKTHQSWALLKRSSNGDGSVLFIKEFASGEKRRVNKIESLDLCYPFKAFQNRHENRVAHLKTFGARPTGNGSGNGSDE